MNREEIIKALKKKLTEKRFVHSIAVEYTAANLAFVWGEDLDRARTAALLHDYAKCLSAEDKLKKAMKLGFEINSSEEQNPDLLHGKLSAHYAHKKFGITDPEILSAITYHTTGHPDMCLLDKIIYVADYIEPNRKPIRDMDEIRKEAFTDLDACVTHILRNTLEYLEKQGWAIDDMTEKTYFFYVAQNEEKRDEKMKKAEEKAKKEKEKKEKSEKDKKDKKKKGKK